MYPWDRLPYDLSEICKEHKRDYTFIIVDYIDL